MSKKHRQAWDLRIDTQQRAAAKVESTIEKHREPEGNKMFDEFEKLAKEIEAKTKCAERRAKREPLKSMDNISHQQAKTAETI